MNNQIVTIAPKKFGLEESKAANIVAQFQPMLDKMVELEKEYNEVVQLPIEAAEKVLAEQRAKADAERKIIEEQARKEAAERAKFQAELQAKKDAELKAEQERQAAIEVELSKGDSDKMQSLFADLEALKSKYQFKSKKHQTLYASINELIDKTVAYGKSKV